MQPEVLNLFKALADANRLKIVGLLAQEPRSVEELAELLELRRLHHEPTTCVVLPTSAWSRPKRTGTIASTTYKRRCCKTCEDCL